MIVAEARPYPPTGLTTALWGLIPPEPVRIADLITTQRCVRIDALLSEALRPGSDPYPLVVAWDGRLYLEDGRHKVTRAAMRGEAIVQARVFRR